MRKAYAELQKEAAPDAPYADLDAILSGDPKALDARVNNDSGTEADTETGTSKGDDEVPVSEGSDSGDQSSKESIKRIPISERLERAHSYALRLDATASSSPAIATDTSASPSSTSR